MAMPRSTSVTVTLAPATTAPLASRTRPTMAPASFCAHSGVATARTIEKMKAERVCRREREKKDMAALLDKLSGVYYELLLLLSFYSVCQPRCLACVKKGCLPWVGIKAKLVC